MLHELRRVKNASGLPPAGEPSCHARRQSAAPHRPWRGDVRSRASGDRTAAEVKIRVRRIAARPAAASEVSAQTFSAVVGPGPAKAAALTSVATDCSGTGSTRRERGPRFGAAVCPSGKDGGLLDLGNRHRPSGQEAEHNVDATWDVAIAGLPTSDAPRTDAEQLGDAVLCDAERAECRAEFGRGHCRSLASA